MAYPIDSISFQLGTIFAFAEMVVIDMKRLAFSLPFPPNDYRRLIIDAKKIAKEQGVQLKLDKQILTTDLFPEEFTRGKWVFLIYKYPEVLEEYLRLKSEKKRLIHKNGYQGKARMAIAIGLGKLLSYKNEAIREKLKARRK